MTLTQLQQALKTTGLPVAYGYFDKADDPQLPCITFELAYTSNFLADRIVYHEIQNVDIFLYTTYKDEAAEALVQNALNDAQIFWDKTETYLPEQKVYQILYEVKI